MTNPKEVERQLLEAVAKIKLVVDGLVRLFTGADDETVNNGTDDLPTLAKLVKDAQDQLESAIAGSDLVQITNLLDEAVVTTSAHAASAELARQAAEDARDEALTANGRYATPEAGFAATDEDDVFAVPAPEDDNSLALYRNDGVEAVDTGKRVPSTAYVAGTDVRIKSALGLEATFTPYPWIEDVVGVAADENGDWRILSRHVPGQDPELPLGGASISDFVGRYLEAYPLLDIYPDRVEGYYDQAGDLYINEVFDSHGWRRFDSVGAGGAGAVARPYVYTVWFICGQSNAEGRGDALLSPVPAEGVAYEARSNGTVQALADPTEGATDGSIWPSMAIAYHQLTGHGSVVMSAAVGSSGMAAIDNPSNNWDVEGENVDLALAHFAAGLSALDSAGYDYQIGGLIWSQGETSANATGVAAYKAAFTTMVGRFRAVYGERLPIFIIRTGTEVGADESKQYYFRQIRIRQMELCRELEHVFMAYTGAVHFPDRGLMKDDNIHYTQAANNEIGRMIAPVLAARAIGYA